MEELGENSTLSPANVITLEKTKSFIRDIGPYLTDEKLYKPEQILDVFKLEPSESFVNFLNDIMVKFKRKKSKDKFLKQFYGNTNAHWREYFHPYHDKKTVFLMLIHLPEHFRYLGQDINETSQPEVIVFWR